MAGDAPAPKTLGDRNTDHRAPLAARMRPRSIDEIVGQEEALSEGSPLHRLLSDDDSRTAPSSLILWGPPGTGKTTIAYAVAQSGDREFVEVSAVLAGVKDIRTVVDAARSRLRTTGRETVLFVDEVHRFSKSQQDALLPSVENRWVTLIAATTENPYFSIISPLLSRSIVLTLSSLTPAHVDQLIDRALSDERGLGGEVELSDEARAQLLRLAGGDARKALTSLEAAASSALRSTDRTITPDVLSQAINQAMLSYDKTGDQHYDVASAFIKSMRGSDVDASLHYLARMIESGEDPRFIARRVVIAASEEVGMADPSALQVAVAAMQAVQMIGMPEGRIPLAQAVVHIATAPKSNASYAAINKAIADVRAGKGRGVPAHLRDSHYKGAEDLGHGEDYVYAHSEPRGVAAQQYAPDDLVGVDYYEPTDRGREASVGRSLHVLRQITRGHRPHGD
ncbi:replication-associated recombination protein A [Helcobacillus massiliensis]|uniref:replication-associated recombination protein A n=1 Tax=Helcobacillus sp. ACRRO TaxID=2918202 RepID=UPI001EF504FB|nr:MULTISPECIES: replication-associated recombination protein A [Helcobacillus]MCG7427318.1 replication-associated recombination protein A [Helcobacillus sp. ACRRO]MCT1557105.1 replication-associated recombination protein A [Helcobacillus massiliensis]MCT2036160.1 replication-associated recombination protein A [Helcobacillus massiliensis]MCT2331291.1 replication-associated recombination protein A [Helcobacillus massiliensis]MDK7741174.1 replication-associated recombination protein A [Helcobaci